MTVGLEPFPPSCLVTGLGGDGLELTLPRSITEGVLAVLPAVSGSLLMAGRALRASPAGRTLFLRCPSSPGPVLRSRQRT